MKNFLGINKTPPALEKSLKVAARLKAGLPTDLEMERIPPEELLSLVEEIHVKTRVKTCENFWESIKPYKAYKVSS